MQSFSISIRTVDRNGQNPLSTSFSFHSPASAFRTNLRASPNLRNGYFFCFKKSTDTLMSTHHSFSSSLPFAIQSSNLSFKPSSLLQPTHLTSHMHCMASPSALSVLALLVFIISSLCIFSEAKEFLVGDKTNSWQMPSFPSQSLNKWAEANRFHVGDSLVWKFSNEKDSVLVVKKGDYESCNVSNPVAAHKGGNVTVALDRSGSFYFISGIKGRCEKGEKMVVVVMTSGGFFPNSPAPSPSEFSSTAIPPTSSSPGLVVLRSGFAWGVLVLGVLGQLFGMVL